LTKRVLDLLTCDVFLTVEALRVDLQQHLDGQVRRLEEDYGGDDRS
jgi:hypothetical protein